MKKSIDFKSQDWCDFVFKDKNKDYGAYEMRMSSSKRHIAGLIIVFILTLLVAFVPMLLSKAAEYRKEHSEAIDMDMILSDANTPTEVEVKIEIPEMPAVPKEEIINSIKFTPPVL